MSETVRPAFTKPLPMPRPFDRALSRLLKNAIKLIFAAKPGLGSYVARMERARSAGRACGSHEAYLIKLALGKDADREKAIDWLNAAIEVGREELQAQRAIEREIEAWDMSFRIMFMVTIVGR